jgi:hypothetical protein
MINAFEGDNKKEKGRDKRGYFREILYQWGKTPHYIAAHWFRYTYPNLKNPPKMRRR